MSRVIKKTFKVGGVATDVTSAKLSDPTGTFGVKRIDTDAVIVADGTNLTRTATGTYEYTFDDVAGVAYSAYVEFVYGGATYYVEVEFAARVAPSGIAPSYSSLLERVGEYLFGTGSGFSSDQTRKINICISDGLNRVYTAHDWSFLRPLADVVTTAPYATGTITIAAGVVTLTGGTFPSWAADGVLKANNKYYSVASRGSNTQITLDDTSATQASASSYQLARPEIPLDAAFEAIGGEGTINYYPGPDRWYPPVTPRHDATIRMLESDNPELERPLFYSVRTARFDPLVGSRKVLALYPAPDRAYTLRVPMVLRPIPIDDSNPYPIGGELLAQAIIEACLAAAEHNFEERNHVHEDQYQQQIALAIANDQRRSSPTELGPDAPRGERGRFGMDDYGRRLREHRIGTLTFDGDSI